MPYVAGKMEMNKISCCFHNIFLLLLYNKLRLLQHHQYFIKDYIFLRLMYYCALYMFGNVYHWARFYGWSMFDDL